MQHLASNIKHCGAQPTDSQRRQRRWFNNTTTESIKEQWQCLNVYFMRCNLASTSPRCSVWDLESPLHQVTGKCMLAWTPTVELCQNKEEETPSPFKAQLCDNCAEYISVCSTINRLDVWCVWRYRVYAFMHAHFVWMLMSVSFHAIFQLCMQDIFRPFLMLCSILESGDCHKKCGWRRRKRTILNPREWYLSYSERESGEEDVQ